MSDKGEEKWQKTWEAEVGGGRRRGKGESGTGEMEGQAGFQEERAQLRRKGQKKGPLQNSWQYAAENVLQKEPGKRYRCSPYILMEVQNVQDRRSRRSPPRQPARAPHPFQTRFASDIKNAPSPKPNPNKIKVFPCSCKIKCPKRLQNTQTSSWIIKNPQTKPPTNSSQISQALEIH